jgi:preprotein translocase subunit SecG
MQYLLGTLLFFTSLVLILLVLVQRGRGGGLAGAFGGMGGQSAFGTKAGDLFTRITVVIAAFWILLSVAAIKLLNQSQSVFGEASTRSVFDETSKAPSSGAAPTGLLDGSAPSGPGGAGAGQAEAPLTPDSSATSPGSESQPAGPSAAGPSAAGQPGATQSSVPGDKPTK